MMVGLTEQDRKFLTQLVGSAVYAIASQAASMVERQGIPMSPEQTLREFGRLADLSYANWMHTMRPSA